MNFQYELQAGQLPQVDRELAAYGSIDSATRWLCWTATRTSCCATSTTPRPLHPPVGGAEI